MANGTVCAVKNGAATVNAENYTIVSGAVTIKKEYLATLTAGDKTFTFVTDNGSPSMTVTVTTS